MAIYAGHYGPESIEFDDGSHAILTRVTIFEQDGVTPAVLYNDRDKTAFAANPASTSNIGNLLFYADPGNYIMSVSGMTLPVTVYNDPAEPGSAIPAPQYLSYRHEQSTPATVWTISHTLPYRPGACRVVYSADPADVIRLVPFGYLSDSVVEVYNQAPAVGTAILS